jgi:hypothetical protein
MTTRTRSRFGDAEADGAVIPLASASASTPVAPRFSFERASDGHVTRLTMDVRRKGLRRPF